MTIIDRNTFVRAVLDLYLGLPDTAARRPSRHDRDLAVLLFDRGVAFDIIRGAFLLASARRSLRDAAAPPLQPVRSLHYFIPVIQELIASAPPDDYLHYLQLRFGHLLRRPHGQIPADWEGR